MFLVFSDDGGVRSTSLVLGTRACCNGERQFESGSSDIKYLQQISYYLYMESKIYKCKYCGKEFDNPHKVGGHTYSCPENPNHKQNMERSSKQFCKYNEDKRLKSDYGICKYCGTPLTKYGKKFCNSSCAAKFHNQQRKESGFSTKGRTKMVVCCVCGAEFETSIHNNPNNYICNNCTDSTLRGKYHKKLYQCTCISCGKEFHSYKKDASHCSNKCQGKDPELCEKNRQKQLERVKNGTHKGWQTRNIRSYPEKFWMNVLKNNNIDYVQELYIKEYKYFLDFVIEIGDIKIDLEIDGKQHNYPLHKEHDMLRDSRLKDMGYVVYRIPWNEINTDEGKELMKSKIDAFMDFINKTTN